MGRNVVRDLSNNLLAQLFAQESTDPFLTLFTMSHDDWATDIHLVNNTENIISNGNTFYPFPVELTLPVDDGESARNVQIKFDNVSRELIDEIRSVTDRGINVAIHMVLASDPDTIEIELGELKIKAISYNETTLSAELVMDDFLNTELTEEKYTPTLYPGLF